MKDQQVIQTAWEISVLINRLGNLLWDRYEQDFPDIDPQEQADPCLDHLKPRGLLDTQDKTEG